ncbi:MAG: type II toxin-antitoxin system VapC family toxin [Hyphomicrobiaceae bacterium]
MRLLLDTHIALWALLDDPRLSREARALILDPSNTVTVSVVSVWEITIKHALARGQAGAMPMPGSAALGFFRVAGYEILPLTAAHAVAIETLPAFHSDPFDRLLVAQAHVESLRLLTADRQVASYDPGIVLL